MLGHRERVHAENHKMTSNAAAVSQKNRGLATEESAGWSMDWQDNEASSGESVPPSVGTAKTPDNI